MGILVAGIPNKITQVTSPINIIEIEMYMDACVNGLTTYSIHTHQTTSVYMDGITTNIQHLHG